MTKRNGTRFLLPRGLFLFLSGLAPAALCLTLSACASTGDQAAHLAEAQERDRRVTDLRLSRVEERLDGVEKGLNDIRGGLERPEDAPQREKSAPRRRAATGNTERLPAAPVVLGTRPLPDMPAAPSIPYLPSGDMSAASFGSAPQEPASAPALASSAPALASPTPALAAAPGPAAPVPMPSAYDAAAPGESPGPGLAPTPLRAGPSKAEAVNVPSRSDATGNAAYDQALALYNKGEYDKARRAFDEFLKASPSNPLAANALYWQGECSYSQGKYDEAIILFKDVAAKYPKHAKAPASLLKAGYAYERMKDMDNARFYWQLLLDDYPASSPASLARKKMSGSA